MWLCRCECEKEFPVEGSGLRDRVSPTRSCASCRQTTHGHSNRNKFTLIYRRWGSMIQRCENPNDDSYENYGGRGISVCNRWFVFENFFADMGEIPGPKFTIDRINNDGNYEPSNCRWATRKQQNRNRRSNRFLTVDGQTKTLIEWSEISGLSHSSILGRLEKGMSHKDAVFTPRSR